MTDRTLRDKIASLPRYEPDVTDWPGVRSAMIEEPGLGEWLSREAVLALLDAHTAAQPAPDAVAEAAIREAYEAGWHMTEAFCVHEDSYQMAAAERLENVLTALRDAMPEVDQPAAKGPSA